MLYLVYTGQILTFGDNTELNSNSCIIVIGRTILIFGGMNQDQQVTELFPSAGSISKRIWTLPFEFVSGRCTHHEDVIYLCFSRNAKSVCQVRLDSITVHTP